jgi:transposase
MDRDSMIGLLKDDLIDLILALQAEIAELKARLNDKATPQNSSLPPSKAYKANIASNEDEALSADAPDTGSPPPEDPSSEDPSSEDPSSEDPSSEDPSSEDPSSEDPKAAIKTDTKAGSPRRKPRSGEKQGFFRALHENPDAIKQFYAKCPANHPNPELFTPENQVLAAEYDRIDLPPTQPHVTRVQIFSVKDKQNQKHRGDPESDGHAWFAPNKTIFSDRIHMLVAHFHATQAIGFERLTHFMNDVFGLRVSEGSLVNMIRRGKILLENAKNTIKALILGEKELKSDETTMRVEGQNHWFWSFLNAMGAVFECAASRGKAVVSAFLGDVRPDYWQSDRYGGQKGWSTKGYQVCLAHLIRDCQRAIDRGDAKFAPKVQELLKRACRIGRRRDRLKLETLTQYQGRFDRELSALFPLAEGCAAAEKLRASLMRDRAGLWTFMTVPELDATNNVCERALRPCVTFRKVTNGFRSTWGADTYAATRSIQETARLNKKSPFQALSDALKNVCTLPKRQTELAGA